MHYFVIVCNFCMLSTSSSNKHRSASRRMNFYSSCHLLHTVCCFHCLQVQTIMGGLVKREEFSGKFIAI